MPNCCDATDAHFGAAHAVRDLKRYRKRGPDPTTAFVIESVKGLGVQDASLVDVGAGIGAIHHALIPDTCDQVTHVDLSVSYLKTARQETERLGHADRVRFVHGDLVSSAHDVPISDIVVLDRVVCCYPDYRQLLGEAINKCHRILALSCPRDTWFVRFEFVLDNLKRVIMRDPFRSFVHPTDEMEGLITAAGFEQYARRDSFFWRTVVYQRRNGI